MRRAVDFVLLDADLFHGMLPVETEKDRRHIIEQLLSLSGHIAQSSRPVPRAKADNPDMFGSARNRRFFTDIACLALVCEET